VPKRVHSTAQHSTAQHSTAQHSTAQHSTAQHSTAQHSTAQHSTCWWHLDRAHAAALWHIRGHNLPKKHSQTVHISLQHHTKVKSQPLGRCRLQLCSPAHQMHCTLLRSLTLGPINIQHHDKADAWLHKRQTYSNCRARSRRQPYTEMTTELSD